MVCKKDWIFIPHSYPTISKVFVNDVPRYVLTNAEQAAGQVVLTDRDRIPELGSRTNPGQIPRTKAEGPGTRSRPNSRKAKCIRHLQVRLVIPQHLRYPWLSYVNHKISKSINFTPKLTKRYPQGGIHAQPQPVKSILVRLNRPHLAPIRFDGKYG